MTAPLLTSEDWFNAGYALGYRQGHAEMAERHAVVLDCVQTVSGAPRAEYRRQLVRLAELADVPALVNGGRS